MRWVLTIAVVWASIALTMCAVLLLLVRKQLIRRDAPPGPLVRLDPSRDTEDKPKAPA